MASPHLLDFDALVKAVSAEAPSGANLRADISPTSVYYRIKDARAAARATERAALAEDDSQNIADWRTVFELAPNVLATQSKDLEIVAWMIEAAARIHGFAGMRDGFKSARLLVEGFWETLYPLPDEDGLLTKVAPISGLNGEDAEGTLIVPIARIQITEGPGGAFASWQYHLAHEISRIEDAAKREARLSAGAISLEKFNAAVLQTPPTFFENLVGDLEQCLSEYTALCAALEQRCGAQAPPSTNIRNALQSVLETVRIVGKDALPVEPAAQSGTSAASATGREGSSGSSRSSDGLGTRDEAFRTLIRVAEFFRRTEPHSPLSYQLEQAVRWGRMPLSELVNELIPDDGARTTFRMLTGIQTPQKQ